MAGTSPTAVSILRPQILDRRRRLEAAATAVSSPHLDALLAEVDAALDRIDKGLYGLCETCHEPIETERLFADPLVRVCLDHLSEAERRAHEGDLELAARIQAKLLPPRALPLEGWETHYQYEAAGPVGGDYCEVMTQDNDRSFFFAVGDVAGKGIAASLLMTHLSATLRSLLSLSLPMPEVMSRANRLFCEGTLASHYATLVCGRVAEDHGVEICNAGHCPPLIVGDGGVQRVESPGLPLGMFCHGEYPGMKIAVASGESLVLYTDGVTEARDPEGNEFGEDRLIGALSRHSGLGAQDLTDVVLSDLSHFRRGAPAADDLTLLVIRRRP
jgi:sigma-B regulation protein RsbU (phosphoserine phosphatase)